jgi:hypothetical protein
MQSRSSSIEVESNGQEESIHCKEGVARSSMFGRKKVKKNKGGSSAGGKYKILTSVFVVNTKISSKI